MKHLTICLLLLAAGGASQAAYRCGNVFQDRPCEDGSGQMVGSRAPSAAAAKPAPSVEAGTSAFAALCTRIGQASLDISWRREAGVLRESQLRPASGISAADHAQLLDGVYSRRGSSLEICKAVESDCLTQKQQEAQQLAILNGLQKNAGPAASPSSQNGESPPRVEAAAPVPVAAKANPCLSLRSRLAGMQEKLRVGGNMAQMERLNAERRQIESESVVAKC